MRSINSYQTAIIRYDLIFCMNTIMTRTEFALGTHENVFLAIGNNNAHIFYQGTDASSEGVQRDLLPLIEGDWIPLCAILSNFIFFDSHHNFLVFLFLIREKLLSHNSYKIYFRKLPTPSILLNYASFYSTRHRIISYCYLSCTTHHTPLTHLALQAHASQLNMEM